MNMILKSTSIRTRLLVGVFVSLMSTSMTLTAQNIDAIFQ